MPGSGKAFGPLAAGVFSLALALSSATAQQPIVYPSQGQSPEQQSKDQAECQSWATGQTGFDPANPPPPPPSGGTPYQEGGVVRGAARGAVVGVVAGAIAGDAGEGAAIGAATGGLIGGFRRADQRRSYEQEQDAARAQYNQQMAAQHDTYNRALAACLQGRGYTVS
jgi:hypothetical protein